MSTNALTLPLVRSAEAEADDSFVNSVLVCMVLVALPIKNSAYLVPPAFVALQALTGNIRFVGRTLAWGSLLVCISTLSILIDSLLGKEVNLPGMFFGFLTFASLAVILGLRSDFAISPAHWRRLRMAVSWFVIFQSLVGMLQFAASGNPDTVCGTFGLLDFRGGVTIAQVYLTFNLFAMVMFLLTDMRGILAKSAIVIGLLACALAHSGHQTIFFIASLAFVGVLQMRFKDVVKLGALLLVLVVLLANVTQISRTDIEEWYRKAVVEDNSPKRMVTISAAEVITEPKNFLLGTGLGQYSSRAALISSGNYLTTELPRSLTGMSDYYLNHIVPARIEYEDHGETSAISEPFCSVLNLIVELGVPLALLLLFFVSRQFFRNWRLARLSDSHARAVGLWANVGLVFFVLCCFIENYVEFPQAIFAPALLYVAALASTRSEEDDCSPGANGGRARIAGGRDG